MSRYTEVPAATGFAEVFRGMRRHKLLLLSLPLASILAGELFLMVNKPAYQAEAQVIVENLATPYDKTGNQTDSASAEGLVSDRMVQSQVSVIKSSDIDARVVDQLGLDQKPEYNTRLKPSSFLGRLLIMVGLKDDPALFEPKDLAARNLSNRLTVYGIPDSNVIGIKSVSPSGDLAAATANAIAETYVLSTHERGASTNDRARAWLSSQIDDLRAKVSASEAAVEKYRADAGLLKGTSSTLGTQQISDLNAQITVAETARAEAEARATEIRQMLAARGSVDASADVLSSPAVQALRQQQVAAQRKLSELSAVYLPGHPKMIAAQQELSAVDRQVRAEALKVVDSLQGQAKVAEARANSIRDSLDKMKGAEAENNTSDVKLKSLQREADANRALLESMLSRYADVNARQDSSLQPGYARIIQRAVAPATPYFPKTGPVLILAFLAGLALAAGLAFILEVLAIPLGRRNDDTPQRRHALRQPDQAAPAVPEFQVSPQSAAAVSAAASAAPLVAAAPSAQPRSFGVMPAALTSSAAAAMMEAHGRGEAKSLSEAVERLAQMLEGFKRQHGFGIFAFTSIGSQAPNAALSVATIGRTLAMKGEKVIALDLGDASSGFEGLLQLPPSPGLADLVSGKADFTKVVSRDPASAMHIIRLGQAPQSLPQVLARLPSILQALRDIYGYVLLHAGEAQAASVPIIAMADLAVILASATRLADAERAANTLEQTSKVKALLLKMVPDRDVSRPEQASA